MLCDVNTGKEATTRRRLHFESKDSPKLSPYKHKPPALCGQQVAGYAIKLTTTISLILVPLELFQTLGHGGLDQLLLLIALVWVCFYGTDFRCSKLRLPVS